MEQKQNTKRKLKRVFLLVGVALAVLVLLAVILAIATAVLKQQGSETSALPSDAFYEADYDKNILEDAAYLQLNRTIYYMQYDSGSPLTEENYTSAGVASEFFYNYFNAVINGDCEAYRSMLTEHYIDKFDPPQKFTMQMLYDIEVNQVQNVWTTTYDGNSVTVYYFAVKYKIFENNGTFRNDVASNRSTTQYYELYSRNGEIWLNNITNKMVLPDSYNE